MRFADSDIRPNTPVAQPGYMVAPGQDARWRDAPAFRLFLDGAGAQVLDTLGMRDRQRTRRCAISPGPCGPK